MLSVLLPGVLFISSILLIVAIVVALLAVDPMVALISAVAFGSSYALVSWLTNRKLRRNSEVISAAYNDVVKALQEGLGGIRDVLLDGTQAYYTEVYRRADYALRRAQGDNVFIGNLPRPPIESFGMVLIAVLAYALTQREGGLASALPVLVALALGAQRLLPALQQAFTSWTTIAGSQGHPGRHHQASRAAAATRGAAAAARAAAHDALDRVPRRALPLPPRRAVDR